MLRKSLYSLLLIALLSVPSVFADHQTLNVFNTPVGAEGPGPAFPGDSYQTTFTATTGQNLHFATMLVQSNDWFFSPNEWGVPLWDSNGQPLTGDITSRIHLFDSGTEIDEVPGEGENQAPRQSGPNTGPVDPNNIVRYVPGGATPAVNQLIRATLSYSDGNFTLNIENVSGDSALVGPIAPGVALITPDAAPLFQTGEADRGQGLEALAEDGNPAILAESITGGVAPAPTPDPETPAPPPSGSNSGIFAIPVGGDAPAPAFPGDAYEFSFDAATGESLHLATMLVQTNDWFFSPNGWGIPLYDSNGNALSGDVTDYIHLYDAGTEIDETPGAGPNQAPRQSGPDTGPADPNRTIRRAHDNSGITPAINKLIKATLTHNGDGNFTFRIENISSGTSLPGPIAPGVAIITSSVNPLFENGAVDRNEGLEALAEDGNPVPLAESIQ